MSSETSIESHDRVRLKPDSTADSFHPWQLFTLAGLIGATIVVFVSRGQTPAGVVLLSLVILTAAIVGIAAWRTFAPFSGREAPGAPQVLGGRTRAALEREKALVLRSIKELEFDRAMGKVSEKDFAEMSARLRARAARLIRQLDAGTGYREQIEQEIARRTREVAGGLPASGSRDRAQGHPEQVRGVSRVEGQVSGSTHGARASVIQPTCAACGTTNDADARFCKECGASLQSAE